MEKITGQLTVFFDDPFWVGVFERIEENKLSVCRVVFGAEPKDYEVYDFILKNYSNLKFSSNIEVEVKKGNANPKRLQREARKQSKQVGTKSQLALKQQREEMKLERKTKIRKRRELEKQRKFELKQEKRKQKHRGK